MDRDQLPVSAKIAAERLHLSPEPSPSKPSPDEPSSHKPSSSKPSPDEPSSSKPSPDEPSSYKQSSCKQSSCKQSSCKQSSCKQSSCKQSSRKQSSQGVGTGLAIAAGLALIGCESPPVALESGTRHSAEFRRGGGTAPGSGLTDSQGRGRGSEAHGEWDNLPRAARATAEAVTREAERWLGTPYRLGGGTRSGVDCSHFVHEAYSGAGRAFPYVPTHAFPPPGHFRKLTGGESPVTGDVVLFRGHMGIFVKQGNWNLISAQSGNPRGDPRAVNALRPSPDSTSPDSTDATNTDATNTDAPAERRSANERPAAKPGEWEPSGVRYGRIGWFGPPRGVYRWSR